MRFFATWALRRPLRMRPIFRQALRDRAGAALAAIEVERIAGPVLVIAGGDDQLWPSADAARAVLRRLREHGHPYADEHLDYPGAGHFVCLPYALPGVPPITRLSAGPAFSIDFGGTAEANAQASRDSWAHILRFLCDADLS
jgi:acetyl esterase/lipase